MSAVAYTGETILITAEGIGTKLTSVVLSSIGKDHPLPIVRKTPPFTFSLAIPRDVTPGMYPLRAMASTESGNGLNSNVLWIDVERRDQPVSIRTGRETYTVNSNSYGPVTVYGTYEDGSTADLTGSTQTSYIPEDSSMVRIQAYGVIRPLGKPGTTYVDIRVGDKSLRVKVIVETD